MISWLKTHPPPLPKPLPVTSQPIMALAMSVIVFQLDTFYILPEGAQAKMNRFAGLIL